VTQREKEIETVTFPLEMTVGNLESSDKGKGDIEKSIRLMAELVQLPVSAVRKMRADDFNRAASVMNVLMGKDQEIGGLL
jgi:hypothetical protein